MAPFRNERILIVSPEAWGSMRISKHHYATSLARAGAQVYFMGPRNTSPTRDDVAMAEEEGLVLVTDTWHWPGQRFLPRWSRALLDAAHLAGVARRCGGGFDILWNFDAYRFRSLRSRANARVRLLHLMDLPRPWDAHEPASNADLVIAVSQSMIDALGAHVREGIHVPHGILPRPPGTDRTDRTGTGPHIGYAGNLAIPYLDLEGILRIATEHPQATIHLFGPWSHAFGGKGQLAPDMLARLRNQPNIRLHGQVPSSELHERLSAMDLLLVAYDSARFPNETRNSHKVLEYLMTGRPVLASHMADLVQLHQLLVMAPPGTSIADLAGDVLRDLHKHNAPERMAMRKAYAASMSYDAHLLRIADALRSLNDPART
ncbi:MAG: glycosyltransferase [Flavobacteriales bacterium]